MVDTRDLLRITKSSTQGQPPDPFFYGHVTTAANLDYACKVCMASARSPRSSDWLHLVLLSSDVI